MTQPAPTLAQQKALAHAMLANELATPDEDDRFLPPGQLSVVRAYRALAHALLASFVVNIPDDLLPPPDPTTGTIDSSLNATA